MYAFMTGCEEHQVPSNNREETGIFKWCSKGIEVPLLSNKGIEAWRQCEQGMLGFFLFFFLEN